jgi:hypothetical protein
MVGAQLLQVGRSVLAAGALDELDQMAAAF